MLKEPLKSRLQPVEKPQQAFFFSTSFIHSPITGRLFDKFGPKWVVPSGLIIITVVLWFLSGITIVSPLSLIIVLHSCLMIGVSMAWMPGQSFVSHFV